MFSCPLEQTLNGLDVFKGSCVAMSTYQASWPEMNCRTSKIVTLLVEGKSQHQQHTRTRVRKIERGQLLRGASFGGTH